MPRSWRGVSETTSSRLLTLLSLLQGRRDWPGSELADRLEVSAAHGPARRRAAALARLSGRVDDRPGRRLPAARRHRDAAAAARRRRGDRDRGRPAHGGGRGDLGDRGDRGARAGQARAGPARRTCAAACRRSTARRRRCNVYGGPTVDPQTLTMLAAAVRDHERVRFAYTARDRAGTQPRDRAALARQRRPPLVPRRLRLRARGLAHVPRRPHRRRPRPAARASTRASCRPRTPPRTSRSRCTPTRRATRRALTVECPAVGAAGPALARRRRHAARRGPLRAAHRPTTTSTGWRCGSR